MHQHGGQDVGFLTLGRRNTAVCKSFGALNDRHLSKVDF